MIRVIEFEQEDEGSHILLSNIYASTWNWANLSKLKVVIKDMRLKKNPAMSWIEIDGEIAIKDIITKNPQSKYLDDYHGPLAQVFGLVKKACVNFMGPDVTKKFIQYTELLMTQVMEDKESYIYLKNFFSQYKAENDARFESLKDMGASHLWIPYFLKAYNELIALPIFGSVTTFEVMV
ncbi:hypothetical protein GIB67_027196 [Kingdonia uniflora]|uniref:Uncharacterized protein n=1 Tax=Kingdonia uniflora TaxID=39325 RepID=A0A7J7KYD3_9MAGN|nr:hypothetical protein GIB67_027196 [Kingdonia uniflora]